MGNEETLTYGRDEVLTWVEPLIERAIACTMMKADGDLARLRKVAAVDELLVDVVLFISGVRELLEAQKTDGAAGPRVERVLRLLERGEGDEAIQGDLIEDERVTRLHEMCLCGVDRGDHLVDAPHGTEDGACMGFVAIGRATLPDVEAHDTERPAAEAL